MTPCEVPKEQWPYRLVNCLTGSALSVYQYFVYTQHEMEYDTLKDN